MGDAFELGEPEEGLSVMKTTPTLARTMTNTNAITTTVFDTPDLERDFDN